MFSTFQKWKTFSLSLENFFPFMENIFPKEFIFRETNAGKSGKRFPKTLVPKMGNLPSPIGLLTSWAALITDLTCQF